MDPEKLDELIRRLGPNPWADDLRAKDDYARRFRDEESRAWDEERRRREEHERRQWEGNRTSSPELQTLKYISPPRKNQNMRSEAPAADTPYMRKAPKYKID
ncbi:MAG: hypothetical protein EBT15_11300 [Betaproteobacteria bacterium]|nr:hypothetical protein [Betaproteobacteria bacterium]